ncbi:MAG: secondary thiamine-phosphate synthase enzyme YjbQ [Candidatus Bathyarchaeia archaeon]|jgi:secondary thiamine-phosphate synthase enzyme
MSDFKIINKQITFNTEGPVSFIDLSDQISSAVAESKIRNGLVHVFAPHATGVLVLTENDPALLEDIKVFLESLVPSNEDYQHPSNAYSHLRSILLPPDRTLPVIEGEVAFGTWQSLMFIETDVYPRRRTVTMQVLGET